MALKLTEDEWKKRLTPEQYRVLRGKDSEAPYSGALLHNTASGEYTCAACGNIVFSSKHKFDDASGWLDFYNVANNTAVNLQEDRTYGMHRIEVLCANCGSHLGHVFHDAPRQPTGMRFCVNSVALEFKKGKKD